MYYIIAQDTGQIVDTQDRRPTQAELEEMANEFETTIYVISGEHTGLSAAPNLTIKHD